MDEITLTEEQLRDLLYRKEEVLLTTLRMITVSSDPVETLLEIKKIVEKEIFNG